MLNEGDIDFMKESQDEIYAYRQKDVTVIYADKEYDDFTGEIIGEKERPREAKAVITEISLKGGDERYMVGGIEYEQADAKIDVKLEYVEDIHEKVTLIKHGDIDYVILGGDLKGIGKRNRIEYVGRESS